MGFAQDIKTVLDVSVFKTSLGTSEIYYENLPENFDLDSYEYVVYTFNVEENIIMFGSNIQKLAFQIKVISYDEKHILDMSEVLKTYLKTLNASNISFPSFLSDEHTINGDQNESEIYMNTLKYQIFY